MRILTRYVVGQFLGIFALVLAAFVVLYLIVDFFDRLDILLRHDATAGEAVRYFVFKVPLMVTQLLPPAVMTACLISLSVSARRHEIVALRASGVSLGQMGLPLLVAGGIISVAALAWNESIVPFCSRQFEYVNKVEIRGQAIPGHLSEREIWYHGELGFYNVDFVDRSRQRLWGVVIYRFDEAFGLDSVVEIPRARWDDGRWHLPRILEHPVGRGLGTRALDPTAFTLPETFDDFLEIQRNPEELSYLQLRQRIADLTRKGIDAAGEFGVELQLKLALPFSSLVLALLAVPLAGRVRLHPSIAATVAVGAAVGFAYWVVLGLASSLGEGGALPAWVAAWAANAIFALLGAALFVRSE